MSNLMLTVDDLHLTIRRSARRKTMQITVERDGSLILSTPPEVEEGTLRQFVQEKSFWIYSRLAEKERLQR
ncbi:YgjP-like metallopeptidase domain-containing protein, partial [Pseudomonas profundi]